MTKPKDRIREAAKKLFSQNGYDTVSLRMIAEEAGTTIGNLTYHYRRKEDLIAAIQKKSQADFMAGLDPIPQDPRDITRHLSLMAKKSQKGHDENPFYFRNMIELCGNFTSIRENTADFRAKVYHEHLKCFDRLRTSGHMRVDIPIRNYSNLAYIIVILVTIWTQNASSYDDHNLPRPSLEDSLRGLVFPYLTPAGRKLFQEMDCPGFPENSPV
ncbi:MAG: TetR/AcrR family transcriptional regulator [Desulfobulbus sp.]|jgi:AcrR family transcriptional regulator